MLLSGLTEAELDAYFAKLEPVAFTERTMTDVAALRAEVAKVAEQGYSLVDQEVEPGFRALSAPVRDRTGQIVAACNVSAHPSRVDLNRIRQEALPLLLEAAQEIEHDLRASQRIA